MLQPFVITLAVLAWLTSVLTFGFGLYAQRRADVRHSIDVVGGLASGLLWFVAAFGAMGLEVVSSGVTISKPATAAGWLFVGFGALMTVVALIGTGFLMNVMDIVEDEAL